MSYSRKDLTGMIDLSKEEILHLLDTAENFREINKSLRSTAKQL